MGSRNLAKEMTKKLRKWTERQIILEDNRSGFGTGRSAAEATQSLVRIAEDSDDLKRRRAIWNLPQNEPTDPESSILDLRKAYPRVNKAARWEIPGNYVMEGSLLGSPVHLHEVPS